MKKVVQNIEVDELVKIIDNSIDKKIEGLAMSVAKGFKEVDERFNKVDERFNSLEMSINRRFFESNDQLFGLQDKVARIETLVLKNS